MSDDADLAGECAKALVDAVAALVIDLQLTRANTVALFGLFTAQWITEAAARGFDLDRSRHLMSTEFTVGLDSWLAITKDRA